MGDTLTHDDHQRVINIYLFDSGDFRLNPLLLPLQHSQTLGDDNVIRLQIIVNFFCFSTSTPCFLCLVANSDIFYVTDFLLIEQLPRLILVTGK